MKLKDKTCLVYDYGYYFFIAQRLAEDFGRVLYCVPGEGEFPKLGRDSIGRGFAGIEKIDENEYRKAIDSIDLFVFPFVGNSGEQFDLRKRGKRVFGCGEGEKLEQDRHLFKQTLDSVGLPTIKYRGKFFKQVFGVDALRKELEKEKDFWIKISKFRGLGETFHHLDWKSSSAWFYELAHVLGERRDTFPFNLEDSVEAVEVGHDSFFTNGKFLSKCMVGVEAKDTGYSSKIVDYKNAPYPLKNVDAHIAPVLSGLGVRGAVSTEVRIVNAQTAYFTDATMRFGSPPSEVMARIWKNFSEILYSVAGNEDVVPESDYKYGASVFLCTENLVKENTPVTFPDQYKERVQLQCPFNNNGQIFIIPQNDSNVLGAAIGLGKTREAAEVEAMEVAESVKAKGIYYDKGVFDSIDEVLKKSKELGVELFK